jgi:hypothetical protein
MREPIDRARLEAFMRALAAAARRPLQVYLVGGATAVLEGWRASTIDVDLKFGDDADPVLQAVPAIKESLNVNVELASPMDFIPVKAGWQDRSPFIAQEGTVTFRHFDLYAQALAKIERGHRRRLQDYFNDIEPELYRFPAVDPPSFRRAVEAVTSTDR